MNMNKPDEYQQNKYDGYYSGFVILSESYFADHNHTADVYHLPGRLSDEHAIDTHVSTFCGRELGSRSNMNRHSVEYVDLSGLRVCETCLRRKREFLGVSGERATPARYKNIEIMINR
jgi:hypothetical protein